MDLHLREKVVVITGGGTGIGKATARAFAKEGAKVVICGRRLTALEQTRTEFSAEGLEIAVRQLDVCDTAAMQALAEVRRHRCLGQQRRRCHQQTGDGIYGRGL